LNEREKIGIRIKGDVAYIPLTQGKTAIIDAADVPLVEGILWHAVKDVKWGKVRWYARASIGGKHVKLHHRIMGNTRDTDHKDGDGLNDRRSNLRPCDDSLNQANTSSRGGSSRYKGVSWLKGRKRWLAAFMFRGQHYFCGYFKEEDDAARAYNTRALEVIGEFARLNEVTPASHHPSETLEKTENLE
jgi:hypothetical protein